MDECGVHHKKGDGRCGWCGRVLCRLCTGKRLGNQRYCQQCSGTIDGDIEAKQLHRIREQGL